jgi:selenocysteine lyase/cysteine desulfurase
MNKPDTSQGRRQFISRVGSISLGAALLPSIDLSRIDDITAAAERLGNTPPKDIAQDEAFWSEVQKAYHVSPDFINLENGYFSPAATAVLDAQIRSIRMINETPSFYMRKRQVDERLAVKKQLAEFAECSPGEIAITRNTTESLDTIISGLDLKAGDEAIMTNQDYGSMVEAFNQQSRRLGIVNKIISLPLHPGSSIEVVSAFEQAITPKTKVMLVTHMINLTGQILPAREICDMAHAHGVEVILDAAHSFAHIDFKIPDTHCDYMGASLHKWLCTPLGNGILYIRKEKIKNVWPLFGDNSYPEDDIRKFEHIGTHPVGNTLPIADAIRFHNTIGSKRKEERLRFLKNYWVEKVRPLPDVKLNTPLRDDQSCAIANVAIEGATPAQVADFLFEKHRIFTVAIDTQAVKGVRITPHLYTRLSDLDQLVVAMQDLTHK